MAKSSASRLAANKAQSAAPKSSKKTVIEVSFEPAEGGIISKTRHREGDDSDFGMRETKTAIHPSMDHAAAHLMKTMEGCFTEGGSGNKPAAGHSSEKRK
jgi:hypothetical protein